jgi:hypothetical protein
MTAFPGENEMLGIPDDPLPTPEEDATKARIAAEKVEMRNAGLTRLLEQVWFREWMMDHLVSLNTFGHTFAATPVGFPDPHATFFHLGMKAAGTALWEQLDGLSPELVAQMRRERFSER